MFSAEIIADLRARVAGVTGISLPYSIDVSRVPEGLCVCLNGSHAEIGAEDENALARGLFLLSRCVRVGVPCWTCSREGASPPAA